MLSIKNTALECRARRPFLWALAFLSANLSGCALRPPGERDERQRLKEAGRAFEESVEVPPLPEKPEPSDYLRHAFLTNANLRARYYEWRAAVEQIPQDASFPNLALSFSFMFTKENMSRWDRTTLGLGSDPMQNIPFPSKLSTAGRRALELARAAGLRFEAAKFELQREVLTTYADLTLLAESSRIQQETVSILRQVAGQAAVRVQTGTGSQQELLQMQTELDLAENDLLNLRAQLPALTARMNALLNRDVGAPVFLPDELPAPRPLPLRDDELIKLGSERNPELRALAHEVAGREEALELARQAYLPDFGLSFSLTGSISKTLGAMLILPTRLEAIEAAIAQARADLQSMRAAATQYEWDLAASFVLDLTMLRNAERQAALFERVILPRARQAIGILQTAYGANRADFLELLAAQRTFLAARLTLAQVRVEREKALAELEARAAVDAAALGPGGGAPQPRDAGNP
ncbi:MAG: TolC family protein [Planctomycetota bacterium]